LKHWEPHPTVRTGGDLSFGERAADVLKNAVGTWVSLLGFLAFCMVWIWTGGFGIDPPPFFRLNLGLSCLAGVQASAILIAQKRADRIDAEVQLAQLDFHKAHTEILEELRNRKCKCG
jgi:uncharacterized membrane protein